MGSTGNMPPGARPWAAVQAKWSSQDMERNKAFFNLTGMKGAPSNFFGPKGPADKEGLARDFRYQRCLTAVRSHHPEKLGDATDAMFRLIWMDERDASGRVVITNEVLVGVLERAGLSNEQAVILVDTHLASPENKELLKETCAEAVGKGAFGAPTMCIGDKIFFGSDRFEQLCFDLGLPWSGPDPARPTVTSSKL